MSDIKTKNGMRASEDLEVKVSNILNEFGIPCNINGRGFIEKAILLMHENERLSITNEMYVSVAKEFSSTPMRVERAIRYAIEHCFSNTNPEVMHKYFGNISLSKGKLPNGAFIMGIVKYIKINERLEGKKND